MASRLTCALALVTLSILGVSGKGPGASSTTPSPTSPNAVTLQALYRSYPPFAGGGAEGKGSNGSQSPSTSAPGGVFPSLIVERLVPQCFPLRSSVATWQSDGALGKFYSSQGGYDLFFPVSRTVAMASFIPADPDYQFIPILESPGAWVLVDRDVNNMSLMLSVFGTWPLGLALLSTAALAGVIIWILETHWNPEGFPRDFIKGLWEGIWWAWVTMSTVGYGDKTPMSIPGRIFAYVWILVGIIFMSIFTATVTTAISTGTESQGFIQRREVGVLNGTLEEALAITLGAEVTVYSSPTEVIEALDGGYQEAALMDAFSVLRENTKLVSGNIGAVRLIDRPAMFGLLVYNMTTDTVNCLHRLVHQSQADIMKSITDLISARANIKESVSGETAESLLGSDNTWIYAMLGGVSGLIVLLLVGEAMYNYCWKQKGKETLVTPETSTTQLKQLKNPP